MLKLNFLAGIYTIVIILPCKATNVFAAPLSLKDLFKIALTHQPTILNSKNNILISKLNIDNSFGEFLPSVDLSTNLGYLKNNPNISGRNNWSNQIQLNVSEKIYNNGLNFIAYEQSKKERLKKIINFEKEKAKLYLEITNEYYNYLLAIKLFKVQKIEYGLYQKQFSSIESQYRQGIKKRIDYLRFKANLKRSQLDYINAKIKIEKTIENIKNILAWKTTDGHFNLLIEKKDFVVISQLLISKIELKNHYDYRLSSLSRTINNYNVEIVKKSYSPEFFFDSNITYSNSEALSINSAFKNNHKTIFGMGFVFKLNLWDWGRRGRKVSIAKLERKNQNLLIDNTLIQLNTNIRKLLLTIEQQKENYLLNKELVDLETKNYNSLENDYKKGKTSFLDLTDSLKKYTSAKYRYFQNVYQLKKSLAQYYYHKGNLYEKIDSL